MIEPIYLWFLAMAFAFFLFALLVEEKPKSGPSQKHRKTPKRYHT